jgi:hypothetical protein
MPALRFLGTSYLVMKTDVLYPLLAVRRNGI